MKESPYRSSSKVVSVHQATLISGQRSQSLAQAQPVVTGQCQKFNFVGSGAIPFYNKQTGRVDNEISCVGYQLTIEKNITGCKGKRWALETRYMVYSPGSFVKIFSVV